MVNVNVSHVVPSMHISSEVISPSAGSPTAAPPDAVPRQVMSADVVVSVPLVGLAARAVVPSVVVTTSRASKQRSATRTPNEFNAWLERTREISGRPMALDPGCE